ncbi:MAG: LuxR C-terminal-related transcriptional regulator [Aggregatilineales bacterium]
MPPLLRTKIQIPPIRTQHIYRDRVLQKLNAKNESRLILVSAPAGFGKSSCLIEWAHTLRQRDVAVAWYALDEQDNDPVRFTAYLLKAFSILDIPLPALPDADQQITIQESANYILNSVTEFAKPVVLLLDDYHLITTPQIHDAISRLCEYMPPNMRLALGTRADPPIQLARLRAQGEITEVRMADLRFTTEETKHWLQTTLGWSPSTQVLTQLDGLTEGWAAALALIMMSQSHSDEQALENQLTRYSLSQRHIFDYFAREVFEQQSDNVQHFLLDTCVLNRLYPNLCSTLTDNHSAPLLLNQIATESLFVIPLSVSEPIYRYHHLFEQFLRQYLQMQDAGYFRKQHRLAAQWYAEQDDLVEAVHHALASEDFDFSARLIENYAWETLTARGEIMTIMTWLKSYPVEALERHPRLCLYFSRALYLTGDVDGSQNYLQIGMDALENNPDAIQNRESLQAIAYNYKATLSAYHGDVTTGMYWIKQAKALQQFVDGVDQVRIMNTDAFLYYLIGDVPSARQAYEHALTLANRINHHYLLLDAHYYLAQIDLLAGALQAVHDRCEKVMARYTSKINPLSIIMLPLASVHYQRNHIVEAESILRDAITLARQGNIPDALWFSHVLLADVLLARGETEEAEVCINKAWSIVSRYSSPMMTSFVRAAEARILLASGQIDRATDWANDYQQIEKTDNHQDHENVILAQVFLAQGNTAEALSLLTQLTEEAKRAGRMKYVILGEILRALTYQLSGEHDKALESIDEALTLAQPHNFVRVFLDIGKPIVRLLRSAINHQIKPDYAGYLLELANQSDDFQHPADVLTDREIEVLEHIAGGASNQDIAESLVISLGTVKSHIHHIMNKLDAQNRTEAVSKARSLTILKEDN